MNRLRSGWEDIKHELIADIDKRYGVFQGITFVAARFAAWVERKGIPWTRLPSGQLALDDNTFRKHAKTHPSVAPLGTAPNPRSLLNWPMQANGAEMMRLELSLVEKIAVTLWRQRRLVKAETATIELGANTWQIASAVESGMGLSGYGENKISVKDLEPPNQEQIAWCQGFIAEYQSPDKLNPKTLRNLTPLLYAQLTEDAKEDGETIEEYLSNNSLEEYVSDLMRWSVLELAKLEKHANRFPEIMETAEKAKDKLGVPWSKLDLLNKYQTTLDSQLYKAMKALREAQEWRLKCIDGDAVVTAEAGSEAA